SIICSPMTSLKTSIKTITYLSDIGCLEIQGASLDGYEAQFGVQPTFVFLVASTTIECGRYPVEIFMMGEEAKLAGQQEYHRNLRTLSDCLNTDEWPAIKTLSLPRWAKEYAND
ncbi:hypothetical protein ACRWHI_18240, partial [Escherichia coli]